MASRPRADTARLAACLLLLVVEATAFTGSSPDGERARAHTLQNASRRLLQAGTAAAAGHTLASNITAARRPPAVAAHLNNGSTAGAASTAGAPSPEPALPRVPANRTTGLAGSGARAGAARVAPPPVHAVPPAHAAPPGPPPGTFFSCETAQRSYQVHTAWAPTSAAPALTYTGVRINDRPDECADVPDPPPVPAAGIARGAASKALSGVPAQVLAKAAEPGLPVGIYYYGTDGQRWELGGGLTPRLLPARNMRAHVPPYAVPAVPQTGGTQGLSRGALLAAALGACAGAAALLCAALVACGCCWLPRNVGGSAIAKPDEGAPRQRSLRFWSTRVHDDSAAGADSRKLGDVELGGAAAKASRKPEPAADTKPTDAEAGDSL